MTNNVSAIHGDKQQQERDWVLNEFKTGKSPIMVATDVASRGIGMIEHSSPLRPLLPFVSFYFYCLPSMSCDLVRALSSFVVQFSCMAVQATCFWSFLRETLNTSFAACLGNTAFASIVVRVNEQDVEDILHWTKLQFQEFLSRTVDTMPLTGHEHEHQQTCFDNQ